MEIDAAISQDAAKVLELALLGNDDSAPHRRTGVIEAHAEGVAIGLDACERGQDAVVDVQGAGGDLHQRPVHLVVGDWGEVGRQGRRETGDGGHQQQDLRRFSENRSLKTR